MRDDVLKKRYLQPGETEDGMYRRVAHAIAKCENDKLLFYKIMKEGYFLPNSPTLVNAGVENGGGLSACYVVPIEDSLDSIYKAVSDAAIIHKNYGGTGFDLSSIRPKYSVINSTGGESCGPVKVLHLLNQSAELVSQGGKRQGANMGILRVDHPDIFEFIRCKSQDGVLTHFNISVAVTEEFMKAVERNLPFQLRFYGKAVKTVDAIDIWNEITDYAWMNGDPGIVFIDEINKYNSVAGYYDIVATNPCGEQPLGPYESCNLGSINLAKFVTDNGKFDSKLFSDIIRIAVRFLDGVIDSNHYPLESIKDATLSTRKIGLGVMGWHDCLIKMGIPYCSEAALNLISTIGHVLDNESVGESVILANEYGEFPYWEYSTWRSNGTNLRNATVTTIAPTGTISFLVGCSSGIEPHYARRYTRTSEQGTEEMYINVPEGETALEIPFEWHIKHQAMWQQYIHNAVSKTINMKSSATVHDVRDAYMMAYKMHCKGVTIYRDGCKDKQVLTPSPIPVDIPDGIERRPAHVYYMKSGCGSIRVIIDHDDDGNLHECFVLTAGGCAANNESTGRIISTMLQNGIHVGTIVEQLKKVKCINAMRSSSSQGNSCSDVIGKCLNIERMTTMTRSESKGVYREVRVCPECGKPLEFGEGCGNGTCKNCGWSGC